MSSEAIERPDTESSDGTEMSLMDHLRELRTRLTIAAIAVGLGSAAGFALTEPALQQITILLGGKRIYSLTPFEAFMGVFTISLTIGVSLAMPVILYQVIAFVMPGLLPHEKRMLKLGFPAALLLFVLGAAFAWFALLPNALAFLTGLYPQFVEFQIRMEEIVPFVTGIVFWMGISFQLPIVMFMLAKFNVVNARILVKNWRYAIIAVAIIAAFITPTPDPLNMGLVMAPLLVLYVISIGLAWLARRGAKVPAILDPEEKLAA